MLTSGNDAEILQIAARDGKDELSIYVKLCHVISPEASAVNKLTFQRGMLFYDGKPITDAVALDVALKNFKNAQIKNALNFSGTQLPIL